MRRPSVDFWAILALIGLAALWLSRPASSSTNVHLENAHRLAIRHIQQRDSIRRAIAASDSAATATGRQGERVSVRAQQVRRIIDNDRAIIDTLAITELRVRHSTLIAYADTLVMSVSAYQDSVHAERMARLRERMAWQSASATQDSIVAAWQGAYHAEHRKRWRYRGEGAVVGLVTALLLVIAL